LTASSTGCETTASGGRSSFRFAGSRRRHVLERYLDDVVGRLDILAYDCRAAL
jgi:hypothetical protein